MKLVSFHFSVWLLRLEVYLVVEFDLPYAFYVSAVEDKKKRE